MNSNILVPLKSMIDSYTEDEVQRYLSSFKCSRDKDLEQFIMNKSIEYEKRDLARTYLLIDGNNDRHIIGYITLALTTIVIPSESKITKLIRKRLNLKNDNTTGYLIGQLCKNDDVNEKIGRYMMDLAFSIIDIGIEKYGGRAVCIDCKRNESLINWYKSMGFKIVNDVSDTNLCRMIRFAR